MFTIRQTRASGGYDMEAVVEPLPLIAPDEVLIEIAYAGFNRADTAQRRGLYPSPQGESEAMGLECSGEILEVGADVEHWRAGDRVCALLGGGGYASHVAAPASQLLPLPAEASLATAAGLPEVCSTIWCSLIAPGLIRPNTWMLLQGASGGIGAATLAVCRHEGMNVVALAHGAEKIAACYEGGAATVIDYRSGTVRDEIRHRRPQGFDVQLNVLGPVTYEDAVLHASAGGVIVALGVQLGRVGELSMSEFMRKRLTLHGANLRHRPRYGPGSKAEVVAGARAYFWPRFDHSEIPLPDVTVYDITEVNTVHRLSESGDLPPGKIVFRVGRDSIDVGP